MKENNKNEFTKEQATKQLGRALVDKETMSVMYDLIIHGADVNGLLDDDEPFIIHAIVEYPDDTVAKLLFYAGATMDTIDELGMTPFMHTLDQGSLFLSLASEILSRKCFGPTFDSVGRTPMWHAAGCATPKILSSLYDAGFEIDIPDDDERTPLMHAADNINSRAVDYFLHMGASVDHVDLGGRSALMLASWYETDKKIGKKLWRNPCAQMETVDLLISAGADVNKVDKDGRTPLMYTAFCDAAEVAYLLVKAGAGVHLEDKEGSTALDIAESNGADRVAEFFRTRNA
jgi:ankyrin repeat protein